MFKIALKIVYQLGHHEDRMFKAITSFEDCVLGGKKKLSTQTLREDRARKVIV